MKVGIDNYSFHRYFGELWPGLDADPGKRWTVLDFIAFAREAGVSGVSIETCFMPSLDAGFMRDVRAELDDARLDRVLAWGHPTGLEGGRSPAMLADLQRHIPVASALGATTMRIVASLTPYSAEGESEFGRAVVPVLKEAARAAADGGVRLALENHGDFTSTALLRVLEQVDSPWLVVTLDTGNALRLLEDPVEATRRLAPWVAATHVKDVTPGRGSPRDASYWPAVPVGRGVIDFPAILGVLDAAGYAGLLCVEIDNAAPAWRRYDEESLVRLSVSYLRAMVTVQQSR